MASQNIARLGVVLGLDTAEFQASVDKAISENTKLKNAIRKDSEAAAKEIVRLKYATEDYGKSVSAVTQMERELSAGKYRNAGEALKKQLLDQAKALDAVSKAQKNVNFAMTEQQKIQLTYQTTDLFTQIASGQNPMIAIMQQGGQLKDAMGGLGNMFKAIGTLITPVTVGLTTLGAVIGATAYAAYQGIQELDKLRDTLTLTGNFAGITTSKFYAMSDSLQKGLNITLGDAKEVMMQLAGSGKFLSSTMESVGKVIGQVAFISGRDIAEVGKDMISLFDGTTASAKRLNDQYHFLNLAQYKRIEQLEKEGRLQESAKMQADLLAESLESTTRQLGHIESGWIAVRKVASEAWNAMMGWGREDTIAEKIAKLQGEINRLNREIKEREGYGFDVTRDQTRLSGLQENMRLLQKQLALETQIADEKSKNALADKQKIDDYSAAGGSGKSKQIAQDMAKLRYEAMINEAKISADEIGDIEIEAAKKVYDEIIAYQNYSDVERRVFGEQLYEQMQLKVEAILMERNNKIAEAEKKQREKQWQEDLKWFEQYSQVNEKLFEDHYKAVTQTERDIANRKEELQLAHEKVLLQHQMFLLSDKERALLERKLETEKEIAMWKNSENYKKLTAAERVDFEIKMRDTAALKDATIELADSLKTVQDISANVWKSMEQAIEQFVMTGKFSIQEFTKSVLLSLISMQAKAQALSLFRMAVSSFSGMFGGAPVVDATPVSVPGRAVGGPVSAGSTYLVGERGPELFMPSGSGTIVPNNRIAEAQAQPTVVYNGPYIANMQAIDTQSATQFLARNKSAVYAANMSAQRSIPTSR